MTVVGDPAEPLYVEPLRHVPPAREPITVPEPVPDPDPDPGRAPVPDREREVVPA